MADQNVLATQLTVGLLGSGFLQWLKSTKLVPFVTENSGKLNHIILLLTSAGGALGIHSAWTAGEGGTISIPSLAVLGAGVWIWMKQWTVQYLVHKGAFGSVAVKPIAAPLGQVVGK